MTSTHTDNILEAVARGNLEGVKYLVEEKGVSLYTVNDLQQTAAHVAIDKGHFDILRYLLNVDKSLLQAEDCVGNRPLHLAVESGNLYLVQYLVEERQDDIFAPIWERVGNTAVHLAAQSGHLPVLQYFIEKKYANFNLRNKIGESLLFLAAEKMHMDVVKYLVGRWNADVNILDNNRHNILFVSTRVGDLRVPQYLLDERNVTSLDVNYRDNEGRTIIFYAAAFGWLDFIKYFVEEKNADFNIPDFERSTPMHQAAAADHMEVVIYLVHRSADPEAQDSAGQTPLDLATNEDLIRFLKMATHKRVVRSVPSLSSAMEYALARDHHKFSAISRPNEFMLGSGLQLWRDGTANGAEVRQLAPTLANSYSYHASSLLSLMVNAFVKSRRFKTPSSLSLTPSEIVVRTKMDSVAIAVVNDSDTYFKF